MSDKKPYKSRTHILLLYPDDSTHKKFLEEHIYNYEYALVKHDKDTDEDGVIKKEHYHCILKFKNQQYNTALSKECGVSLQYIQQIRNEDLALEYLIHYNEPTKYQYSIEDVKGPYAKRLIQVINKDDKTEGEKITEIISYIDSQGKLSTKEFALYCAQSGYWSEFRRSGTIMLKIIQEHNDIVG